MFSVGDIVSAKLRSDDCIPREIEVKIHSIKFYMLSQRLRIHDDTKFLLKLLKPVDNEFRLRICRTNQPSCSGRCPRIHGTFILSVPSEKDVIEELMNYLHLPVCKIIIRYMKSIDKINIDRSIYRLIQ